MHLNMTNGIILYKKITLIIQGVMLFQLFNLSNRGEF